ncbi:MAG TPA: nucleotidyltransferase family protein [Gammaproteobacteria bacterium]|nr:nucleotidyltransferase family protein [Gammaproteobacteria bacterium]
MTALFPVAILVGGLATRLRPMTETIPKALIQVAGEPFITHQLRLLRKNNIKQLVLCVGYLGKQIQDFVGDGSQFGLNISYVFDGPQLMGTGGAIKQALPMLGKNFFVLYGDSYLPCDYFAVQTAFENSKKLALMTVFHNNGLWDTSNIEFHHGKILAYDKKQRTNKMHYIDYGLSVINERTFDEIPTNCPCDLADFYQILLKRNQLGAYEVNQRFYETGSFAGIQELAQFLQH